MKAYQVFLKHMYHFKIRVQVFEKNFSAGEGGTSLWSHIFFISNLDQPMVCSNTEISKLFLSFTFKILCGHKTIYCRIKIGLAIETKYLGIMIDNNLK